MSLPCMKNRTPLLPKRQHVAAHSGQEFVRSGSWWPVTHHIF